MRRPDHYYSYKRLVHRGATATTLTVTLTVTACSGPWFGPGGFDQAAVEKSASPADVRAFHEADADNNGLIDMGEARARLGGRAESLDIDGDEQISETEFLHHRVQ